MKCFVLFGRFPCLTVAPLVALALTHAARADVLYSTGFEAPEFTAAQPLVGQNGWTLEPFVSPGDTNAATISTAFPASGSQSVQVDGSQFTDGYAGYYNGASYNVAQYPVIDVRANFALLGPGTPTDQVSINLDFIRANGVNAGTFFADLWLSSDGTAWTFGGDGFVDTVPYRYGVYNQVEMLANFLTNQVEYLVNGIVVQTQSLDLAGATAVSAGFSMQSIVPTTDYLSYVDNYQITSVPEPSTRLIAGLGTCAVAYSLRRRLLAA
jgi:hypothetical protein